MTAWPLGFVPSFLTEADAQALCAETDLDLHFPERGGSVAAAKRICGRCELEEACGEWAIAADEKFGVWGGLSERERHRIRRSRERQGNQAPRPINHGTAGGYKDHMRRNQPVPPGDPCGCIAANKRAGQAREAKKKAAA